MNDEREWRAWQVDWQSLDEAPKGLEERAWRQGRRLKLLLVAELLLSCVFLIAAFLAARTDESGLVVWASLVCVFVFAAQGFSLWNWRGAWRTEALSTREFVELSMERCRRYLRMVRFGLGLLAVEFCTVVAWLGARQAMRWPEAIEGPGSFVLQMGLLLGLSGLLLGGLLWIRRSKREELSALESLERELEEPPGAEKF